MEIKEGLRYTEDHEWIYIEDDQAVVGISDYAQQELGDLVFVNLPEVDDEIEAGEAFADVESVKAVSDVLAPVGGTVVEINEQILDEPEMINNSPYEAWFIKLSDYGDIDELMTADEYKTYLEGLE